MTATYGPYPVDMTKYMHFYDIKVKVAENGLDADEEYVLRSPNYSVYDSVLGVYHSSDDTIQFGGNYVGELDFNKICPDFGAENNGFYIEKARSTVLPEDPEKEGHDFAGWYYGTEDQHGDDCTPYDGEPITNDTALHAHWNVHTFTVTYNVNGGVYVAPATVNWNTAAPMPETTRTGYNFVGWCTADGIEYNGEAVTSNITLTAKWDIKMYTVTFYANGAEYKSVHVAHGTTLKDAMKQAGVQAYNAYDMDDVRVSKENSVITEDTQVLMHDLSKFEKYGDFVGRNPWYTWLMLSLGIAVTLVAAVCIIVLVVQRKG